MAENNKNRNNYRNSGNKHSDFAKSRPRRGGNQGTRHNVNTNQKAIARMVSKKNNNSNKVNKGNSVSNNRQNNQNNQNSRLDSKRSSDTGLRSENRQSNRNNRQASDNSQATQTKQNLSSHNTTNNTRKQVNKQDSDNKVNPNLNKASKPKRMQDRYKVKRRRNLGPQVDRETMSEVETLEDIRREIADIEKEIALEISSIENVGL